MRILHLSSADTIGGGERHLIDLADGHKLLGHDVHLVVRPRSPLITAVRNVCPDNISTIPLRNALDATSARALSHLVKTKRIEIIHAHMGRDYPLACFAARQNPAARLIITRHVLFPLSRLHGVSLKYVNRVIAVSKAVARSLREQGLVSEEKIAIIPNGIDLKRFDRPKEVAARNRLMNLCELPENSLLIGTVAELKDLKGHEEFLRAAAIIAQQFPQSHFLVAGDDPSRGKEYLAELKCLIGELNLDERVHLLGWIEDITQLVDALDVFVLASRTESFGLAIIEAMALGIPVVATETEGAREIIQHAETGVLTPINDFKALARAVAQLLGDSKKRELLSQHARERVRTNFSLEQMLTATERLYRECLERPTRPTNFSLSSASE